MAELAEMEARLATLERMRSSGTREVEDGTGRRVRYYSDQEFAQAIADLRGQIAGARGERVHTVLVSSSKGLV